MHVYVVGQLYHPARRSWPQDSWQYNYRGGEHELVVFIRRPGTAEMSAFKSGQAQFALAALPPEAPDVIALAVRFGGMPWSDALYSWHLVPEDQRRIPETDLPEQRILLSVVVVDCADGIVLALRGMTLSPEFTRALHAAIRDQSARPWPGEREYGRQIQALYARYPTSEALARAAAVRCNGGD